MKGHTLGILLGLIAAIGYGILPLITVPLQQEGCMSNESILFYRFGMATIVMAVIMVAKRESFRITIDELIALTYLALLSDGAALFLLAGYPPLMPSGVATTIHFLYPVFTALIMLIFYKERCNLSIAIALIMAVAGVGILSWPSDDVRIAPLGVVFELLSALCFAFYLIRVNRSKIKKMNSLKLTFYVIAIGTFIFGAEALRQDSFQAIGNLQQFQYLLLAALLSTVLTNLALVYAARLIGSTLTSVLGALEPFTAVVIGVLLMGEVLTLPLIIGLVLILTAVLIIIKLSSR